MDFLRYFYTLRTYRKAMARRGLSGLESSCTRAVLEFISDIIFEALMIIYDVARVISFHER